jgi:Tol biopolymer transport system component
LIVFESSRDGAWNLYTIHPDGTGERRLTHRGSRVSRLQRQRDRRDSATPA